MNKGDGNDNKINKNRNGSQFHVNGSFNKSFNSKFSIDDTINPHSEPTKGLVISSQENMNNNNNSNRMENNIVESDVYTTEIVVDDTNKTNDTEKRKKEDRTGKLEVNNNKKKVFILEDSIAKHFQSWEITKKLDNNQKGYMKQFSGSKVSCIKDYVKP